MQFSKKAKNKFLAFFIFSLAAIIAIVAYLRSASESKTNPINSSPRFSVSPQTSAPVRYQNLHTNESPPANAPGETITISAHQAHLNLLEAQEQFKQKYPQQAWEFEGFRRLRWSALRGGLLNQYQNLPISQAALQFLKDHPELLAGLPEGTQLQVNSAQESQTPGGESSILQATYKGLSLPGNIVVWRDKQGNVSGSANSVPALKEVEECSYIDQEKALTLLQQYFNEPIKIVNAPSQEPQKIIRASSGQIGRVFWSIYFQYVNQRKTIKINNSSLEIWQGLVDACNGNITQIPRRTVEH